MIIRIGYSGSRDGMTTPQMKAVYGYLCQVIAMSVPPPLIEGHHGDCLGGDKEFDVIAAVLGCRRIAHPPLNPSKRAWCRADEIRPPKDYLARDRDIAQETGGLLAAPKTAEPYPGSGTWTTVGYAVRLGRPVMVFRPEDGLQRDGSEFFRAGAIR